MTKPLNENETDTPKQNGVDATYENAMSQRDVTCHVVGQIAYDDNDSAAPFLDDAISQLVEQGRQSINGRREKSERIEIEERRQNEIKEETAWAQLRENAAEIVHPALRPYIVLDRHTGEPRTVEEIFIQIPGFFKFKYWALRLESQKQKYIQHHNSKSFSFPRFKIEMSYGNRWTIREEQDYYKTEDVAEALAIAASVSRKLAELEQKCKAANKELEAREIAEREQDERERAEVIAQAKISELTTIDQMHKMIDDTIDFCIQNGGLFALIGAAHVALSANANRWHTLQINTKTADIINAALDNNDRS